MQHESEGILPASTPMPERRWATVFEVAKHLRVDSSTVRRWTRDGMLRAYGTERRRLWDLNEVDAAIVARPAEVKTI